MRALALLFVSLAATADVQQLRLAALAPEGTDWAAHLRRFSDEVSERTGQRLQIKWKLGGVAGDEPTVLMRVLRHELDGVAGAVVCERLAPSMRALELIGLVSHERHAKVVLQGLALQIEDEFHATPFRPLFISTGIGHRMLFSRNPVRSFAELKRGRWWVWNLDDALVTQLREMGVPVVPLPIDQAVPALEAGRVDGFIAVPSAAIAFEMFAHTRYFTDLESGFLPGCLVLSAQKFESLPAEDRAVLVTAAVRLGNNFERAQRKLEADLGVALAREGLHPAPMNAAFRAAFFASGRAAIDRLGDKLAPRWLVEETKTLVKMSR